MGRGRANFEFGVIMMVAKYFIRFKDSFDQRRKHKDTEIDEKQNCLLLPKKRGLPTWTTQGLMLRDMITASWNSRRQVG